MCRTHATQNSSLPVIASREPPRRESRRPRGAHAHYFVFDGATMITLVFQALPAPRIFSLAPLFDRVAATFRVLPAQSGATTAP